MEELEKWRDDTITRTTLQRRTTLYRSNDRQDPCSDARTRPRAQARYAYGWSRPARYIHDGWSRHARYTHDGWSRRKYATYTQDGSRRRARAT